VMTHVHVNEKSKGSVIKHIKAELHLITFKWGWLWLVCELHFK
jgi:hypothetical protein